MATDKNLKVGDVFELKIGMEVCALLPRLFVYTDKPTSERRISAIFTVGDILSVSRKKKFDTGRFAGHYVVVDTKLDGGHAGDNPCPDGHHVFAQKLYANGDLNPEGVRIDFYHSDRHIPQVLFEDVPVIRTIEHLQHT